MEHSLASKKKQEENESNGAAAEPVTADDANYYAHLLQLPNVNPFLISLAGKNLERSLVRRLDWFNYMYVPTFSWYQNIISYIYICHHSNII